MKWRYMREIYINLDDSGKLTNKESLSSYGGVILLNKKDKDRFINQYRSIINSIKSKYHGREIKSINIKPGDKRRIYNFLKREIILGLVINNNLVYDSIKESKSSKGRFIDYGLKRLVKEVVINLLDSNLIKDDDLRIIINIDEQSTKSNGYYKLGAGIYEELKYGVSNFNYLTNFKPIINSNLEVHIHYHNSKYSYLIQASDIVAGTIRKMSLKSLDNNKIDTKLINTFVNYLVIIP